MFRFSLAQINSTVGDLSGNAAKILHWAGQAAEAGSQLVVFPEMSLTGYPPEDLLLKPQFLADTEKTLGQLARQLPPTLWVLVGAPRGRVGALHNTAVALRRGKIQRTYAKQHLPNYGVFDEKRYFVPGQKPCLLNIQGVRVGLTICEDVWVPRGPVYLLAKNRAQLVINQSASPYQAGKLSQRFREVRSRVKEARVPVAYCNAVGGQDELVFDGASFVLDAQGRERALAPQFKEALLTLDFPLTHAGPRTPPLDELEEIYQALVLGTRDYVEKNGFKKVLLGLSGGIDSSLVACVAADAVGKNNVVGLTLPSVFNAPETRADAETLAINLGLEFHSIPIEDIVQFYLKSLAPLFAKRPRDVTEENLQARVRGTLLMALSNKFGWLVLTTGNKSETSVGYCTLYGDMAGGFAVIKDIPKTLVVRLSRWRNQQAGRPLIPDSVFTRPPSAELRPNQKDQDSLPPYDVLDNIIQWSVEEDKSLAEVVKRGVPADTAKKVRRMIDLSEYKRRQSPPGIKITPKAFGRDRRVPITNRYDID